MYIKLTTFEVIIITSFKVISNIISLSLMYKNLEIQPVRYPNECKQEQPNIKY